MIVVKHASAPHLLVRLLPAPTQLLPVRAQNSSIIPMRKRCWSMTLFGFRENDSRIMVASDRRASPRLAITHDSSGSKHDSVSTQAERVTTHMYPKSDAQALQATPTSAPHSTTMERWMALQKSPRVPSQEEEAPAGGWMPTAPVAARDAASAFEQFVGSAASPAAADLRR